MRYTFDLSTTLSKSVPNLAAKYCNINFILRTVSFEKKLALSCKKAIHCFAQRQDLGRQKAL